jgi:hypothetical protein
VQYNSSNKGGNIGEDGNCFGMLAYGPKQALAVFAPKEKQ